MGADGIGSERMRAEPDDDIGAIEAQWRPNDLIQQEVIRTRRHAIQPGVAEPHARQASHGPDLAVRFHAVWEVVGPHPLGAHTLARVLTSGEGTPVRACQYSVA